MKHVGGPLFEGLFLSAHLVAFGEFDQSLSAKLTQQIVHVRAERTEVGVRAWTQAENSEPTTSHYTFGLGVCWTFYSEGAVLNSRNPTPAIKLETLRDGFPLKQVINGFFFGVSLSPINHI